MTDDVPDNPATGFEVALALLAGMAFAALLAGRVGF